MLKNMLVLMGILFLTACSSTTPKQVQTHQDFYNQSTLNPPKSQCVYKSATTESEKALRHKQAENLQKNIYQHWRLPKNVNKDETMRASFEISSSCQITNIQVYGNDTAFKQSIVN